LRPDLNYRLVNRDPPGYRVSFDGVEVGSISKRTDHIKLVDHWHWGVDTMRLMDRGDAHLCGSFGR